MIPVSVSFGISRVKVRKPVAALLIDALIEDSTRLDASSQEVPIFTQIKSEKCCQKRQYLT